MSLGDILLLALALSADAFAVSVCNGLTAGADKKRNIIMAGAFGFAQALFPLLGMGLGLAFISLISKFDHWIAFGLLFVLGLKMVFDTVREARRNRDNATDECFYSPRALTYKTIAIQAVATAIDAFAVGISFAAVGVNPFLAVSIIGVVTFALSLAGVFAAHRLAAKSTKICGIARIAGGVILIGIGLKILIEHLAEM